MLRTVDPLLIKKSTDFTVSGEVTRELNADAESCVVDCLG